MSENDATIIRHMITLLEITNLYGFDENEKEAIGYAIGALIGDLDNKAFADFIIDKVERRLKSPD